MFIWILCLPIIRHLMKSKRIKKSKSLVSIIFESCSLYRRYHHYHHNLGNIQVSFYALHHVALWSKLDRPLYLLPRCLSSEAEITDIHIEAHFPQAQLETKTRSEEKKINPWILSLEFSFFYLKDRYIDRSIDRLIWNKNGKCQHKFILVDWIHEYLLRYSI